MGLAIQRRKLRRGKEEGENGRTGKVVLQRRRDGSFEIDI
jgi:hypothetical protein